MGFSMSRKLPNSLNDSLVKTSTETVFIVFGLSGFAEVRVELLFQSLIHGWNDVKSTQPSVFGIGVERGLLGDFVVWFHGKARDVSGSSSWMTWRT
jgi:hypothetical protein